LPVRGVSPAVAVPVWAADVIVSFAMVDDALLLGVEAVPAFAAA
jgi:hypothetical protein